MSSAPAVQKKHKGDPPEPDEEAPGGPDGPEEDRPMGFWEHLAELRTRIVRALLALIIGSAVAWNWKEKILVAIVKPFTDSWRAENLPGEPSLHFAAPGDAFLAYFNLALIGGGALAAPVIFYQLWGFVAPGLYAREKRFVIPFVTVSSVLFVGGGYFGYLTAFPITFGYFLGLSGNVDDVVTVTPTIMMDDYIGFVTKMLLGFGLIFQIPILFTFLALAGIVNHKQLIKWARYYIFLAFFASAILTPPDWASQLVMAFPACGLYFVSIALVRIFQRKESLENWEANEKLNEEKDPKNKPPTKNGK